MKTTHVMLVAAVAGALVWSSSSELAWPARLLTTLLLVPLPVLMLAQARDLPDPDAIPRRSAYASSAVGLWVLTLLTIAATRASGISRFALGLVAPVSWAEQLVWAGALIIAAVALMYAAHALGIRESRLLLHLLPRDSQERIAFVGLSITAGICEEIVFRAFLITALTAATGSLLVALIVAAVAFGVVHAYQSPSGVARATLLALLLSAPYVLTGSLIAPVIAHTLIDVIGGLFVGPRLARSL